MSYRQIITRELEVAFSRNAQPIWFRLAKYLVLGVLLYVYWNTSTLWLWLGISTVAGLILHIWYRYQTKGWTRSYGGWNYEKNKPRQHRKIQ
ncbi:hypothetical protein [Spirosoma areae]